ncbi:unnamed protein product, partial [Brassica napus]
INFLFLSKLNRFLFVLFVVVYKLDFFSGTLSSDEQHRSCPSST